MGERHVIVVLGYMMEGDLHMSWRAIQMQYKGVWFCFIVIRQPLEFLSRVIWLYLHFRNKGGGLEDGLD